MADEGDTTRQASTDGDSGVHRLRDIVVEEVSLVDRAANKRRFLVVKRSSQMASDDKAKDRGTSQQGRATDATAEGGKKAKPKPGKGVDKARPRVMRAASEDDEEDEETEKARRSPEAEAEEDEDNEDTEKAEDDEDDEEDEEDESKGGKARTRAKPDARGGDGETGNQPRGRAGKPVEKADDDDLILPAAVKNAILRVLAQALERLMAVANC